MRNTNGRLCFSRMKNSSLKLVYRKNEWDQI